MSPGIGRDLILAVGRPTAWIAAQLPLRSAATTLTSWLSPNQSLSGPGAFVSMRSATGQSAFPRPVASEARRAPSTAAPFASGGCPEPERAASAGGTTPGARPDGVTGGLR